MSQRSRSTALRRPVAWPQLPLQVGWPGLRQLRLEPRCPSPEELHQTTPHRRPRSPPLASTPGLRSKTLLPHPQHQNPHRLEQQLLAHPDLRRPGSSYKPQPPVIQLPATPTPCSTDVFSSTAKLVPSQLQFRSIVLDVYRTNVRCWDRCPSTPTSSHYADP